MKKLLLVLAIGVSIAACNNATDSKAPGTDSTVAPVDTTTKAVVVDTLKHDSVPAVKADSVKK